jgi:hypothetical protein
VNEWGTPLMLSLFRREKSGRNRVGMAATKNLRGPLAEGKTRT